MQRLNEILERSKKASQNAQNQTQKMVGQSPYASQMRSMGKFMSDNHFPRYLLFGIILLKSVSIYGKMK